MSSIHPTALVDPSAQLGSNVSVGPYSIIGPHVEIGDNTVIAAHCVVDGRTKIGADNRFFPFCSIGAAPQDKKYAGEPTRLEIGDRNLIRESCTLNLGTVQDGGVTRIGDDNWIMAYVHVAHDVHIGNNTTIANCTQFAGHVIVGDWVTLGGFTGVHQFVRIGAHCMAGVGTVLLQDVPPYVTVSGNPSAPHGVNSEGLKRRGFSADSIMAIRRAYKTLYKSGLKLEEARQEIATELESCPELKLLADFLEVPGRGIVR